MVCGNCGTHNEAGRKFCMECGSSLAVVCPACGSPNAPQSKFCGECGTALGGRADDAPAAAVRPATERRLVSILFADLVGSTSLADGRDPEEVRELLTRYFDAARDTIERYGGLVEKFIGDAVMAVWGTPTAHEDDAERAVRAALELLDGVEALGTAVGVQLHARAGVLTGEAAATLGAENQGIVAGDLVNTASRLQSSAEPGAVLVGEATFQAAGKAIAFERVGDLMLKGKEGPVAAWRALRVVGERGGANRSDAIEPPFVGRAEELRLIKELLRSTGNERKARLVSVSGIGGIGKSRLAWEFEKYADGLIEDLYWHRGRCPAYGDGVAFWALGEMVRMRAGIAETDDPGAAARTLSASVARWVTDPEERRWIEPRLAHLLGLEAAPSGDREELFAAWRTFFERIAEQGTTVMVFEDLQWADGGMLDFIESMLEWSRNLPILIVTLARPELAERRPNWGSGSRSFSALHLEPLPDVAMIELVTGLVRGLPSTGVDRIVARAEGVPMYAVETVRMLADRGVLRAGADRYETLGEVAELDIPPTLHALIAARLDALAAEDRGLLQDASVLGKSFTPNGLAAISGEAREALEPRLRELTKKEFLELDADPRSPERGMYTFTQAMIREVAYATLAKADRRSRHLAAAHHLESLGDEELAAVVATHYVEAFRESAAGPEADALAARARDWLEQAAQRALSLGSPEQALAYAELALDVTPGGAERAAILETAGEAAEKSAEFARGEAFLEEAIASHRDRGDIVAAARATTRLWRVLAPQNRRAEGAARMEASLGDLGENGNDEVRAALCSTLAESYSITEHPDVAIGWAERALPLAERHHLTEILTEAIGAKSLGLFNLGRHREATILARGTLTLADELGSLRMRGEALMGIAVYGSEDDPIGSLRAFTECAEAARRAGDRHIEMVALPNLAESAIELGRWEQAEDAMARLEGRELTPMTRDAMVCCEASLLAHRGDPAAGLEHLDTVLGDVDAVEMVPMRSWFRRVRSSVLLLGGDVDAAFDEAMGAVALEPAGMNSPLAVREAARAAVWSGDPTRVRSAIDAMDVLGGRWIDAVRLTARAGLAAIEDRRTDAAAGLARAIDAWRALECTFDLACCAIDMAAVLPDDEGTREIVAESRAFLTGIGAVALLERLTAFERQASPAPTNA